MAVPRLAVLAVFLWLAFAAGACSRLGFGDRPAEADSAGAVVDTVVAGEAGAAPPEGAASGPPVVVAPEEGVASAEEAGATEDAAAGAGEGPTGTQEADGATGVEALAARIDRLIEGQESLGRRLEALEGGARRGEERPDSAEARETPAQVLGEARRQVRGFGVGVMWSIVVLLLFNYTIRGLVWLLDTLAERNAARRLFFKRIVPIARIILWVFAAYLIVRVIFEVDAQGIIAAAAAVGVAVGFAAQDLLKNLFGGLILVFDQPFQVGDKVSVGGTYGEVVSIGLRSTRIVTGDDNLVSVPNAQVVDQQVANANAGELNCQVVTDLYLPGWADEVRAKKIAFEAAASSKYVFLNKPIVVLVSDVFKETFLTRVRVKAYVLDPRLELLFQSEVTERAREGFREAGLLRPEHFRADLVWHSAVGAGDPAGGGEAQRSEPSGEPDDLG